jgi:hypothetical protein
MTMRSRIPSELPPMMMALPRSGVNKVIIDGWFLNLFYKLEGVQVDLPLCFSVGWNFI